MALGLGGHAVAAGNLANLDAAVVGDIVVDEFVNQLLNHDASFTITLSGQAEGFEFGVD